MTRRRMRPSTAQKQELPRVVAGYLRLTVDRDGNKIGYEVQRKKIQEWAKANDYVVGEWYQDKDITAANREVVRARYEEMLGDFAAGKFGGIVVWRLDRLVRLTREFERCWGLVEDMGGFIISIDPPVDTRNPIGLLLMRLLVMLAEMEIAGMRARQRGHQQQKARDGEYHGGGSRAMGFVGAIRDDSGKILNSGDVGIKHVPHEAELLREAGRRIAYENETYADVIKDWCSRNPPVVGAGGALLTGSTLAEILTSHRIVGKRFLELEDPETGEMVVHEYKAKWDPILDEKTWHRLRAMRTFRNVGRPHGYLLTGGLITCGRCGCALVGATRPKWNDPEVKVTAYRCESSPKSKAKGACGRLNVVADDVEKIVVARVIERLKRSPELLDELNHDDESENEQLIEALSIVKECDNKLEELAAAMKVPSARGGKVSVSAYLLAAQGIEDERAEAELAIARISRTMSVPQPTREERESLLDWFQDTLTLEQRRTLLRQQIREVVIAPLENRGSRYFNPSRVSITPADSKQLTSAR